MGTFEKRPGQDVSAPPALDTIGRDQLFRLLVQAVTDYAIFMIDPNGRVSSWNAGAERIKGYSATEIIGQHFSRFYTEEDRAAGLPERGLRQATANGQYASEGWRVRKDGTRFFASVVLDRVLDDAGNLIGFAKITRDITDRVRAEAALRESEHRYRLLVSGVIDYAIFMLDPSGIVINWNAGAERIKGYASAEIIGQHFSRFYTEADLARGEPQRALETAAREGRFEIEALRVRKDGTQFWANVVLDALRDDDGRLIGFAKITRDVTERVLAQRALEETRAALVHSQKLEAIGQLTGGVAHDFNNLLSIITSNADLLTQPQLDAREQRNLIDGILRAADRGARLTQQLLAFARRQPLRPSAHSIRDLVGNFESVLRRGAGENIEFELALTAEPDFTRIDATQFETALLNLITNARDAMPHGGKLAIETGVVDLRDPRSVGLAELKPGRYVRVAVRDTGEGMAPDTLARAFEPFYTTKDTGKGSGLGLSQVYGFVSQSGGQARIDSRPGAGTTVSLYLPVDDEAQRTAAEKLSRSHSASAGKVLLVEDDPDVMTTAVAMVKSLGFDVLTAPDGVTALDTLERERDIDILFTDVVMPHGVSGIELARRARNKRANLKILLASGYPTSAFSAEGLNDEFAFLSKPYRWAELSERLRGLRTGR